MNSQKISYIHTVRDEGDGDRYELIQGARYHPENTNKTVAKEVKRLIAEAIKAGLLPAMKVSVVSNRYHVGVRILEASFDYKSDQDIEAKELITRFLRAYQRFARFPEPPHDAANFYASVQWWVK